MENATKALLIAGSVLIAILLIAVGMRIFNSAQGSTDAAKVTMDATAIASFNNQFAGYFGASVRGSKVLTLQQKVLASNAVNTTHTISGTILTTTIDQTKKYKVEIPATGGYDEGYIKVINITVL